MTIEQEEQRVRDLAFMRSLGFKMTMDIPCPKAVRGLVARTLYGKVTNEHVEAA